jgi:hypothetical protein
MELQYFESRGDMPDVFISHRNDYQMWVEVLANNLMRCGLRVKQPSATPRDSVGDCNFGIVLVTPEALESGWAQQEYEVMSARKTQYPAFRFLFVTFGLPTVLPFNEQALLVDFSDRSDAGYVRAFRHLLCGLKGWPPTVPLDIAVELDIPTITFPRLRTMLLRPLSRSEQGFVASVFNTLDQNSLLMLLAPTDFDKTPVQKAIYLEASRRFRTSTLHLTPLGRDADRSDYLNHLGQQIQQGRKYAKPSDLEFLLSERLTGGKNLFLMISRMDDSAMEERRMFSLILRNLHERYSDNLKIVLCGGEPLLELRFKEGQLSPLRNAETMCWPEPSVADVREWQGDSGVSETIAAVLLRLTGGNMRLTQRALQMRPIALADITKIAEILKQDALGLAFIGIIALMPSA